MTALRMARQNFPQPRIKARIGEDSWQPRRESGQVTGFVNEAAVLPLPVAAHVIGAVSE